MREPTKFFFTAIALMWLMAFPRAGAAQALQEIRIGSSVIGFSSLMSYCARDLKFFEREGLDAKIIYAQTNVGLAALTAGNFDYSNLTTSAVEATLRGMPLRLIAVTNAEASLGNRRAQRYYKDLGAEREEAGSQLFRRHELFGGVVCPQTFWA